MELGWRVKLRRADMHIATFGEESAHYVDAANVGLQYERDPSTGTLTVRLRADAKAPLMLGTIVGDVLHNLRSALDSIAWAACQRAGVARSLERNVYFPIVAVPSDWPDIAKWRLPAVAEENVEVFRRLQPWYFDELAREKGADIPIEVSQSHPLARLNYLARVDRHQVPHPILTRPGTTWVGKPDEIEIVDITPNMAAHNPGDIVYTWRVVPAEGVAELLPGGEVNLALPLRSESGVPHREPAARELAAMREAVARALRTVEVEVLEVVSATDMDELSALHQDAVNARTALEALLSSPHVIDSTYMESFERLRSDLDEAERRHADRWRQLFD